MGRAVHWVSVHSNVLAGNQVVAVLDSDAQACHDEVLQDPSVDHAFAVDLVGHPGLQVVPYPVVASVEVSDPVVAPSSFLVHDFVVDEVNVAHVKCAADEEALVPDVDEDYEASDFDFAVELVLVLFYTEIQTENRENNDN